jgi:radical SAM protein with 4Fe4S-binding SPASM domain
MGANPPDPRPRGRRLVVVDGQHRYQPKYVVWELTLACDQPCTHCGSRAGDAREMELSTEKALEVVRELAAMGTEEVVLIGGEAYLHAGYLDIARALARAGIRPVMTTGGRGIDAARARAMADAGIQRVSVSIDGLEATHDRMRAARGSFESATNALRHLAAVGIQTASNINLNRHNHSDLEALYEHLREAKIRSWQIQLTAPLGRAADRTDMLLQPYDLLTLVPRIAAVKQRAFADGILVLPGNNLGYFGPEEALLRSQKPDDEDHWQGCQAGKYVMGIESDGAVKGCPSLQTSHYVGGRLVDRTLAELWETPELRFARERTPESLRGYCAECPFGSVCMGGCSFTAHAFFGRPGDQPYCHFRAMEMQRRGLRERLVPTTPATGLPFDNGLFELVREPFDSPEPPLRTKSSLVQITRKPLR